MLEHSNIRALTQNERDIIRVLFAIFKGWDTAKYIVSDTNLPEKRVTYILRLLEKNGIIYKKPGTKQWRVRINYESVWKHAEYVYYNEKDIITDELEEVKELKEQEKKMVALYGRRH
jgi:predicted transcriptional regulator